MLKVKLLHATINPEFLISVAAKLCYSSSDIESLMEKQTPKGIEKFIDMLTSIGHESPMEHVNFTFAVEGVSRCLTHQLVRHRIASYSQQSQRYVKESQFEYIIPPEIDNDEISKELFINHMIASQKAYDLIADRLKDKYIKRDMSSRDSEKKAIEDARYVFPNAAETKMIITMNARSAMNFFSHRCCFRAQWEIMLLAKQMLKICKQSSPMLFKNAGASCKSGICPEGDMQCEQFKGIIPTNLDVKNLIATYYNKES